MIKSSYFSLEFNCERIESDILFADSILFSSDPEDLSASKLAPIAPNCIRVEVPPVVIAPPIAPIPLDAMLIMLLVQDVLDPPAIPDQPNIAV